MIIKKRFKDNLKKSLKLILELIRKFKFIIYCFFNPSKKNNNLKFYNF
jgi:hypothetical protein